jgi:hypothetical protein
MPEIWSEVEVVVGSVIDAGLKVIVSGYPVELVAVPEKTTVPMNPLSAAAVMVTAGMVPPAATVTDVEPGVTEKSGQEVLATWTSSGLTMKEPADVCDAPAAVKTGPIEPW